MLRDRDAYGRSPLVFVRVAVSFIAIAIASAGGSRAASEAADLKFTARTGVQVAQGFPGPNVPSGGPPGIPTVPGVPASKLPGRELPDRKLPPRELPDSKLPSSKLPYDKEQEEKQSDEDRLRDEADELTRKLTTPSNPPTQVRPPPGTFAPGTITRGGTTPTETQDPPIGLRPPPPPTIYGEEIDSGPDAPCCGIVGNEIFYPVTKDPQEIKPVQLASYDKRMFGYNVMPHDGGFMEAATDLVLPSAGIDGTVSRTYRSDVKFISGGLIGDGWDFNWNKRIVPVYTRITGTGLGVETIGASASLYYYDGTAHVDRYDSKHSEWRQVVNFGETHQAQKTFVAYVTTYRSPPHEFLEIERYIVADPQQHPFKEHPDVKDDLGESIFYVVRLKDGMRYVFNCRGQVIYIFDKHYNKVEFHYAGPMNPLTHSPIVSEMIDTAKQRWTVKAITIGEAPIATNFDCKLVTGVLPIPRVQEITDPAGRKLVIQYTPGQAPTIDRAALQFPGDLGLTTDYAYSSDNKLTDVVLPKEFAGSRRAFVHNDYDGQGRVVSQTHQSQRYSIAYGGTVTVTDVLGRRAQYEMRDLGDTQVIAAVTLSGGGLSAVRRYSHNPSHQITMETLPRGNRIEYLYDGGNEPVTLGFVRDWASPAQGTAVTAGAGAGGVQTATKTATGNAGKAAAPPSPTGTQARNAPVPPPGGGGMTYENNLSLGNLLGVRQVSDRPGARVFYRDGALVAQNTPGAPQEEILEAFSYEPLFNEKALFIDRRGNQTNYTYNYNADYGQLGVPSRIQPPAATQADGTKVAVPEQIYTYSLRGEPLTVTSGTRSISNSYNARGWLVRRTREDGAATANEYRNDGQITATTMPEGYRLTYERNGRGYLMTSTLDPGQNEIRVRYTYDLEGNVLTMRKDVKDLFPPNGQGAFGISPRDFSENVTTYQYDEYNRQTKETFRGHDGVTVETSKAYDADDNVVSESSPSPAGAGTLTRSFAYDALGRKISQTVAGRTTTFAYDLNDNLVSETDALGRRTSYFHDGFDRKIATADHAGGLLRTLLDKQGNEIEVTFEGDTGQGATRGRIQETKTDYDEYNRPIRVSRNSFVNGNAVTESYYDGNHDLVREKGLSGAFTRYTYDVMGRRTMREDPLGNVTRYAYSPAGFLTSIQEAEKENSFASPGANPTVVTRTYTTTITNDKFGNPISRVMRGGQSSRMGYDSEGNLRVTIDETGRRTVNDYDSRKLITAVIRDGETSRNTYNAAGNKISSDIPGGQMRWTYDAFGNELTLTNTVTGQTITKVYDAVGQLTSTTTGGVTLSYRYDSRGRMTEMLNGTTSRATFRHDGLGRVVGSAGTPGVTRGGPVSREYDGLGNIVQERQFLSLSPVNGDLSLRSEYAIDGSQRILRVPAIGNTPAATYRWQIDPLGRVTRVEFNGELIASYLYSGPTRVARTAYGDFTRAIFTYDGARRPTALEIWSDLARRNLWSGNTTYFGNTLVDSREFYNPGLDGVARSQGMTITLNEKRQPVMRETRMTIRRDSNAPAQQWVHRDFTAFDRIGRATNNVSATFVNDSLTAIRSHGFSFAKGLTTATNTRVVEVQNGPELNGFDRNRADDYLLTPKHTENERFDYDTRGNVANDDQYRYEYDPEGRLSRAFREFADTERVNESANYGYDNFGRLRSIYQYGEAFERGRNFVYDGDQVIAEIGSLPNGTLVLLARYVHGASDGEIVRMDRRENDTLAQPLKTFYVHEGLTGGYNFVTSDSFRVPQIITRERIRGFSESVIEGTATRMPYLARNTRYDPFTEMAYNEATHVYTYDYTRAPIIAWRERQERWLEDLRRATAETQAAQLKIMAIPLLPLVPVIAPAIPLTVVKGAALGGAISVGVDYGMTSYVGGEYSFEQGIKAFGLGAVGGGAGVVFSSMTTVSASARVGFEIGFDAALGTAVEMSSGEMFSDAFLRNMLFSAVGGVGGKVQAAAAQRFRRTPILGADLTRPLSSGMRAVTRSLTQVFDATDDAAAKADASDFIFEPSKLPEADRAKIASEMYKALRNSTDMAWIVADLIKYGDINVVIGRNVQHPTARAHVYARENTIYINEIQFQKMYGNLVDNEAAILDMTSSVVHEGIHVLGGGEISSHLAQGQFYSFVLKQNPKLAFAPRPKGNFSAHQLARAADSGNIRYIAMAVAPRYTFALDVKRSVFVNNVTSTPLHSIVKDPEFGGFAGLLGISEADVRWMRKSLPARYSF